MVSVSPSHHQDWDFSGASGAPCTAPSNFRVHNQIRAIRGLASLCNLIGCGCIWHKTPHQDPGLLIAPFSDRTPDTKPPVELLHVNTARITMAAQEL